jgi:hypothetical protein
MQHIKPLLDKWGLDIAEGFNRFANVIGK